MQKIKLKKEPRLDVKLDAFAYQSQTVEAIRDLEYASIFLEQGLGKTKIAIDLMLYWLSKKKIDTVLFVVKKTLLANWQKEFALHAYIKPKVLTQDRRNNYYVFNGPSRLILAHFEILKSEKERLKLFLRTRNVAVILDESTKIKNPNSSLTEAAFELSPLFKRRIIMTGTPVANRPYDIWSQIWFLDQGKSLGNDFESFKKETDLHNTLYNDQLLRKTFESSVKGIYSKIAWFSVRKTKNSTSIELPQKVITNIPTEWEHKQLELYRQIRETTRAIVIQQGIPREDNAEELLKRLLRLMQITSNPRLVDEGYSGIPGKYEYLDDLVAKISGKGEKCIVWTSYIDNAEWLARELQKYGVVKVHGRMLINDRNKSIDKFLTDDRIKVLVATTGAAKEGLTLTVANHVIFYDRSFSLDDYLQAQDRIHRISQVKTCYVYNLIMQESIDEWIDVLLESKRLAAQLAQGDISLETYKESISYDFGKIIRCILGLPEIEDADNSK